MRGVEAALIGLIVAFTTLSVYSLVYTTPPMCPRCHVNANTLAAWVTLNASNRTDVLDYALEANVTLSPGEGYYTAPVVVWVNGTPVFYTVGWKP